MMAAALTAAVSCTDYSDWNDVPGDANALAQNTLWQNLEQNPELSDFMQVLQRADMQSNLSASHFYTIWAPANGTFDLDSVLECTDDAVLKQFINNHIAEYNHLATNTLSTAERVKTLNRKTYDFAFDGGDYTYNGVTLATDESGTPLYNLPCSNGTLHIIEGNSPFLPNGLEALDMIEGIDMIASYIKQYNDTTLDTKNSVPGSIVDGKQTYLDSVFVISNVITNSVRAKIENEDSTYSILLPNDKAYQEYYDKVKGFYNFGLSEIKWQNLNSDGNMTIKEETVTETTLGVKFDYLADSLAKRAIVNNLFYSNNNSYNMHLVKEDAINYNDTVVTTLRAKYSNGDELFDPEHTLQKQHLSNGYAYVVDTLAFKPWETYNPEITLSGVNPMDRARYVTYQSFSNVRLDEENTNTELVDISDGNTVSYCWAEATTRGKPEVDFYLRGVKAGTYNIYCVIPPANVDLRDETTQVLPNILNFTYHGYYNNVKTYGNLAFDNERYEAVDEFGGELVPGLAETTKRNKTNTLQPSDFVNNTSKVDTMFIGKITIPLCYAGTGASPNIKITSSGRINTFNKDIMANVTRDLRICAIILRPLDYEAYLKEEEQKKSQVDE